MHPWSQQLFRFAFATMWPALILAASVLFWLDAHTLSAADVPASAENLEFFEKEVRPLLVQRCHECHSAKKQKGSLRLDSRAAVLKGGDTGAAIVPGKPQDSLLVDAINYGDTFQMPPRSKLSAAEIATLTRWVALGAPWPDESAKTSAADKKFDLAARRASHWCWQPLARVEPPAVRNATWPRGPIDQFILARLEAARLAPAQPADPRTLIRRVYLDVTGLPPSPAAVEAFVADPSPDAYAAVVDALLASPQFGERWARHWLDLVRYADSYGHEFDYAIPHAAEYRDYVIRALNADLPYNEFVREQIAGDLLARPRLHPTEKFNESIIGTGCWLLFEAKHAPVDVLGEQAVIIDNQIDVLSKTFLGLTVSCARCHDHKFDAISTADYYSLAGFFQSSRQQRTFLDPGGQVATAAQELTNRAAQGSREIANSVRAASKAEPPIAQLLLAAREALFGEVNPLDELEPDATPTVTPVAGQKPLKLARPIAAVAAQFKVPAEELAHWVAALSDPEARAATHPLHLWLAIAGQPGAVTAERVQQQRAQLAKHWTGAAQAATDAARRYETFADFHRQGFGDWFVTGAAFGDAPTGAVEWNPAQSAQRLLPAGVAHSNRLAPRLQGALRSPTFTIHKPFIQYHMAGQGAQIRVIIDGYMMDVYNGLLFGGVSFPVNTEGKWVWHNQGGDLSRYVGHQAYIEILDDGGGWVAIDEIRFSDQGPAVFETNPLGLAIAQQESIGSLADLAAAYQTLLTEALRALPGPDSNATPERTALVDWLLKHQLIGSTDANAKFAKLADEFNQRAASVPEPRRALALADGTPTDQHVYIRGSHKNLDELAPRRFLTALGGAAIPAELAGSGRLELADKIVDPANPLTARVIVNRLWHHLFGRGIVPSVDNFGVLGQAPSHPELLDHLAAQFIADGWSIKRALRGMLLSSTYQMSSHASEDAKRTDPTNALLHAMRVRRLEAEAVRDSILAVSGRLERTPIGGATVNVHVTPFMQGRGSPPSGPLDGAGRRSIYTAIRRNFLAPMMLAFDAPIPFTTMGRRNVSNVPAQALILLNDPFVVEQSRTWATHILAAPDLTSAQRINMMYLEAFSRPPTAEETADAVAFIERQGQELKLTPEQSARDVRVWADLGHVLWNVKDFIFRQ